MNKKIHMECKNCEYWIDGKCRYKKIMAEKKRRLMRGEGAKVKWAVYYNMVEKGRTFSRETLHRIEQTGVQSSGLTHKEQTEYWEISQAYDDEWINASPEKRHEIVWRVHHWGEFMENGLSPKEAEQRAKELDYDFWTETEDSDEES